MSQISVLPEELRSRLGQLDRQMQDGKVDASLVHDIVCDLAALPARTVPRVAGDLMYFDSSFWPDATALMAPRRSLLDKLLGRRVVRAEPRKFLSRETLLDLLARTPRLEHILIFDRDGYVREAALEKLNDIPSAFFVSALALRLNDWVKPVRRAALRCAERTFGEVPATVLAQAALFLFEQSREWSRGRDEIALLDKAFARRDVVGEITRMLLTGHDSRISRTLRFALTTGVLDEQLLTLAGKALNPAVRSLAFRTLINGEAVWRVGYRRGPQDFVTRQYRRFPILERRPVDRPLDLEHLIEMAANDHSGMVRRQAADGLVRYRRELTRPEALAAQMRNDPKPDIRHRITFVDRELGLVGQA